LHPAGSAARRTRSSSIFSARESNRQSDHT
jgi:hypothetical protein